MNVRFIDWIWHIRGSVALEPGQSKDEVFGRLDPLFRERGTSYETNADTLTFQKKDQAAQDKMSVFDSGVLRIENGGSGRVLRYHLISRVLLFCFLAPVMFLGIAQLTIAIANYEKAASEAAKKSEKSKKDEKKDVVRQLHPIDKALGAPAPETPKEKEAKKKKEGEKDKGPSPTPAYVFAGIFAVLYIVGRILEDRLIKRLFEKRLRNASPGLAR